MFRHKSADTAGIVGFLFRIWREARRSRRVIPEPARTAPPLLLFPSQMVYPVTHFMGLNR